MSVEDEQFMRRKRETSLRCPRGPGNNPKTAVREFLEATDRFEIDQEIPNKLLITVAQDGYLKH